MPLGRTEIAVKVHLHGGPKDGLVEDGSIVNGVEPPPVYAVRLTDEHGFIAYAYHLVRVVEPKGELAQVHYRYID